MKEIVLIGFTNFILFLIVVFKEKYQYDYYKENSSDNELNQFNNMIEEKSRLVNFDGYKSWKQPNLNSTQIQIVILTKFRTGVRQENQYFHLTVNSLMKSLNYASGKNILINICNLNGKNESYLDKWNGVGFMTLTSPHWLHNENIINQETLHYLWCLKQAFELRSSAETFIVLEDDIELDETRFFPVLIKYLHQLVNVEKYAIKFYHPPRLVGFVQPESVRIFELVAISLIFYFILRVLLNLVINLNSRHRRSWLYSFLLFLFCLNVTLLISRRRFLYLRSFHRDLHLLVPAPFCCTPGMLYSKSLIQQLTNHLDVNSYLKIFESDQTNVAIDALIYSYLTNYSIPYYYIEPNLITHFGRVSTLRDPVDPRAL